MTARRRSGPNAGSHKSGSHDKSHQKSFLSRFFPNQTHKPRHVPVKPPNSLIKNDGEGSVSPSISSGIRSYFMDSSNALKAILSVRICSALWSTISDCDEVFNYWEPTHYLIYGSGFQTWEYSPQYAIRSYAYLWLHTLPAMFHQKFLSTSSRHWIFYATRCLLALVCTLCETYFYRGVVRQFGSNIGRLTLAFLVMAVGMFVSSTAFLPSSFSMYMTLAIYGSWFQQHNKTCLFAMALNGLFGWPFASILSLPVFADLIANRRRRKQTLKWSLIFGLVLAVPLILIDSYHYGKLVIAPLNIILYNVFSPHGANLYGIEAWSFYLHNLLLNFNIVLVASLLSLPVLLTCRFLTSRRSLVTMNHWLCVLSLTIWLVIFTAQKHKEERFMFPIFPLICLTAAFAIEITSKMVTAFSLKLSDIYSNLIMIFIAVFTAISVSRGFALFKSYNAPLDIYMGLEQFETKLVQNSSQSPEIVNLCVGKEWHRYPSSFFLPNPDRWKLQFLPSEFRGQLPQPFLQTPNGTKIIQENFNDQNLEETSRYIDSVNNCHFIVDTDYPQAVGRDLPYVKDGDFKVVLSAPFLDSSRSKAPWRSFYIPFASETKFWTMINYNLLQNVNFKLDSTN